MGGPTILPRMEDRHFFLCRGIERGAAGGFAQRTRHTSQCEILEHRRASGSLWLNVIDVKLRLLSELRQQAVLASTRGAVDYATSQPCRNGHNYAFSRAA